MTDGDFCRILTLLRKERGITQKQAALSLGVSQALLSHYEKGVRECGLDFVVRAAEFYGVSCDYLLGRSADRSGLTLSADELPDEANAAEDRSVGNVLSTLNKKLLSNSLNVLYGMISASGDKKLMSHASAYLMTAVYRVFRKVYSSNPKNEDSMFSVSKATFEGLTYASMAKADALIASELANENGAVADVPRITTESLTKDYPLYASSMLTLIQQAEKQIND